MSDTEAVLPYAGSSGWSGTDTSKARADAADRSGITSQRQRDTFDLIQRRGWTGLTVSELRGLGILHHGSASGVLSNLHKGGKIERLAQTRDRCKIYVHPDYVAGRDVEPHGRADSVTIPKSEYEALLSAANQENQMFALMPINRLVDKSTSPEFRLVLCALSVCGGESADQIAEEIGLDPALVKQAMTHWMNEGYVTPHNGTWRYTTPSVRVDD